MIPAPTAPWGLSVHVERAPGPQFTWASAWPVGFRSEGPGEHGLAHLCEHLLFQGTDAHPKLDYFRRVEAAGGIANARTRPDFTVHFGGARATHWQEILRLEGDRFHGTLASADVIANQQAVVAAEVQEKLLGNPRGTYPWVDVPRALFTDPAHAHDGYAAPALAPAPTPATVAAFYRSAYEQARPVLWLRGPFEEREAVAVVEESFAPPRMEARPGRGAARTHRMPSPAVPSHPTGSALAWALSGPSVHKQFTALLVLVEAMNDILAPTLGATAYWGMFDEPCQMSDPWYVTVEAPGSPDRLRTAVRDLLSGLVRTPPAAATVEGWAASRLLTLRRPEADPVEYTVRRAVDTLLHDDPAFTQARCDELTSVSAADVAEAAALVLEAGWVVLPHE
ncbi:putative Zn-dependent peptidase [Streptomyces sp. BK022]|uniref:M16 family metallopeptidase n=1 Tax=Streptomyces sp. BK022 TaxID=2512123 RepID=UPI0010DC17BB|nr:insulinase family protein [Streptomyces sp. BK022]RZU45540.1 putative Zn-dependent peptidase [Streptomyces sp. BK022]